MLPCRLNASRKASSSSRGSSTATPRRRSDPEFIDRFKREAQAAATLRSTHVVQILDYGVDDETPFRPRQELPRALKPNGAIYVVRAVRFLANPTFLPPCTVPFEMSRERSIDIDNDAVWVDETEIKGAQCHLGKVEY